MHENAKSLLKIDPSLLFDPTDPRLKILEEIFSTCLMNVYASNEMNRKIISAILFAHLDLELIIHMAIIHRKFSLPKEDDKANKYWKEILCGINFLSKVEMLYVCGVLSDKDRDDLIYINNIRNDIAHGYTRIHKRTKAFYTYKGSNILNEEKILFNFNEDRKRIRKNLLLQCKKVEP